MYALYYKRVLPLIICQYMIVDEANIIYVNYLRGPLNCIILGRSSIHPKKPEDKRSHQCEVVISASGLLVQPCPFFRGALNLSSSFCLLVFSVCSSSMIYQYFHMSSRHETLKYISYVCLLLRTYNCSVVIADLDQKPLMLVLFIQVPGPVPSQSPIAFSGRS